MLKSAAHSLFAFLLAALPGAGSVPLERTGDILQFAVPAAAGAVALGMRDWAGVRQWGALLIVSQGATHLIKHAFETPRPDGGRNGFPSAHTSAAFAGAAFVAWRYRSRYAWLLFAAATLTAYSRLTADKHFLIDVFGGAVLSLLCTWLLVRRRDQDAAADSYDFMGWTKPRSSNSPGSQA